MFTARVFGGSGIEAEGVEDCEVSAVGEFSYEEAYCDR